MIETYADYAKRIRPDLSETLEQLVDAITRVQFLRTYGQWEREQTHESLMPYLLEEAHELAGASSATELKKELGDVLLQVIFHAAIASEFTLGDVAQALSSKLAFRSAPIFAGHNLSAEEQEAYWQSAKAQEKCDDGPDSC